MVQSAAVTHLQSTKLCQDFNQSMDFNDLWTL